MSEDNWLLATIQAKSDQLNAVDLVGGPITVAIAKVSKCDGEQPVAIDIGTLGRPYKPCKSMRRVLIACWGANPVLWIGRQMTLFCDPAVKWGGESVGGIRISHLSHLDASVKEIQLNESKHRKVTYKVYLIATKVDADRMNKAKAAILAAKDKSELDKAWSLCKPLYASCDDGGKTQLESWRNERAEAIEAAK